MQTEWVPLQNLESAITVMLMWLNRRDSGSLYTLQQAVRTNQKKSGTSETLSLKRWKTMLVALIQQTGLLFIHYHHQLARFVLNVLFLGFATTLSNK